MQEELKEYSNVLKEIVKKSTYRATSIPKEYRSLLKEQMFLFLKVLMKKYLTTICSLN